MEIGEGHRGHGQVGATRRKEDALPSRKLAWHPLFYLRA